MNSAEIYNYLKGYMTEERDALFQKIIAERTRKLTVVVENVYQPHNASAVLRSCDCFGVQDVHIIENDNQWEVSEGVAMGASKWLTVNRYNQLSNNTKPCLQQLKENGYRIVATTPHRNDYVLSDLPLDGKVALVFGTEVSGISPEVHELTDDYVRIPMYGFTESFNISVAAALTLYELTDRIRKEEEDWRLGEQERIELLIQWASRSIRDGERLLRNYLDGRKTP